MDVIRLTFLIGPLYLIGVWFGEDQKTKHHINTCLKEIGLHLQSLLTTPNLVLNTIGRTYVFT